MISSDMDFMRAALELADRRRRRRGAGGRGGGEEWSHYRTWLQLPNLGSGPTAHAEVMALRDAAKIWVITVWLGLHALCHAGTLRHVRRRDFSRPYRAAGLWSSGS